MTGRKRLVRPLFTKQRANLVQMHTYPKNDEIHDSLRGLATTRPESTVGREPPQKLKKTRKIRRTLGVLQIRIRCDTSITHTHTQPRARPIEKLLHNSSSGTTYRRTYKEVTPHSPSQQGLSRGRRPQTRNNKIKTANHAVTSRSCHTSSFFPNDQPFPRGSTNHAECRNSTPKQNKKIDVQQRPLYRISCLRVANRVRQLHSANAGERVNDCA